MLICRVSNLYATNSRTPDKTHNTHPPDAVKAIAKNNTANKTSTIAAIRCHKGATCPGLIVFSPFVARIVASEYAPRQAATAARTVAINASSATSV